MRILTVRQPWAWAIIHGGKDVENRVRNLAGSYRGPVAIHVGLRHDLDYDRYLIGAAVGAWRRANPGAPGTDNPDPRLARPLWHGHLGRIIGVVDLVDVHYGAFAEGWNPDTETIQTCSPWAERESWHLVLTNPRALTEPIPFKGALGLRTLDLATVALIGKQVAP